MLNRWNFLKTGFYEGIKVAAVTSAVVVALALAVPFSQIPLSMLAGIIIVTGYRVIDWEFLRRVRSIPLGYTVVMLATATVAVLIGFTMAILVGLVLSTLVEVTRSHRRELERLVSVPLPDTEIWPDSDPYEARVGLIVMPDRVSVASARELSRILGGDIRASQATIMDFGRTAYIDDTCQGRREIRPCGGAKVYHLSGDVQRKCPPTTGVVGSP